MLKAISGLRMSSVFVETYDAIKSLHPPIPIIQKYLR